MDRPVTCTTCGRHNAPDARFCSACGAQVVGPGSTGVRKIVTVVFCDLVGSTALGDRADPERLGGVMSGYHRELRTILEWHGGTVEKFVGDAVMAVFGIPRAHEDDALRAVRAAIGLREAVTGLGLEARIGVNTGEVFAGQGETLVTGDAVNVAARLEQAAQPGEILLGRSTHELVRHAVEAEALEPLMLKGKAEATAAVRLVQLLRDAIGNEHRSDTPFVGRARELGALEQSLAAAIAQRTPRMATIVGPPGIGKSRLVHELARRSDAQVLVGRCPSYGVATTYAPLAEMIGAIDDLRSHLRDDDEADAVVQRIEAALGVAGLSASPEEIAWASRRLFEALARKHPLLVLFDDLHWAEPSLLDLVEYVAAFARDAPLFVVCISRPELFDIRPTWGRPSANAELLAIEPLSSGDAHKLIVEIDGVTLETTEGIVEVAEGNPLFLEQLAAHAAESDSGGFDVPPSIQAVLQARIDGLEVGERAVLERGSIEGRLFHRGVLRELLPEDVRADLSRCLLTLVRKDFIRPDRAELAGDDAFRFGHALVRDVAYETVPKRLRAELHEHFAGVLVGKLGDAAPAETLGYHLEQAYDYRVALEPNGESTHDLALRAGLMLATAGRRAHVRGDDGAAVQLLRRAARLLPDGHVERPALLALLGSSTYESGDMSTAVETLRLAQSAAAAQGQRSVELRARMDELAIGRGSGLRADTALSEVRQAITELESLDDVESLARAWRAVMEIGFLRSQFALVGEASVQLLECARRARIRREEVWAVRGLAAALTYGPTPVGEAIGRVEQGLAEFPIERAGEDHLALLYAFAGRFAEADEAMARSRQVRLELGQEIDLAGLSLDAGCIALLADDPSRAEPVLRAAADVLERAGEDGYLGSVAALLGNVLYRLRRYDDAADWARRSEIVSSAEDVEAQTAWRSVRAKLLALRGDAPEALRLSAESVDWIRTCDGPFSIGDCLASRAEVLRLVGRAAESRPVLEEALAIFTRKGIVPAVNATRLHLAALSAPNSA